MDDTGSCTQYKLYIITNDKKIKLCQSYDGKKGAQSYLTPLKEKTITQNTDHPINNNINSLRQRNPWCNGLPSFFVDLSYSDEQIGKHNLP